MFVAFYHWYAKCGITSWDDDISSYKCLDMYDQYVNGCTTLSTCYWCFVDPFQYKKRSWQNKMCFCGILEIYRQISPIITIFQRQKTDVTVPTDLSIGLRCWKLEGLILTMVQWSNDPATAWIPLGDQEKVAIILFDIVRNKPRTDFCNDD